MEHGDIARISVVSASDSPAGRSGIGALKMLSRAGRKMWSNVVFCTRPAFAV